MANTGGWETPTSSGERHPPVAMKVFRWNAFYPHKFSTHQMFLEHVSNIYGEFFTSQYLVGERHPPVADAFYPHKFSTHQMFLEHVSNIYGEFFTSQYLVGERHPPVAVKVFRWNAFYPHKFSTHQMFPGTCFEHLW